MDSFGPQSIDSSNRFIMIEERGLRPGTGALACRAIILSESFGNFWLFFSVSSMSGLAPGGVLDALSRGLLMVGLTNLQLGVAVGESKAESL